MITRIGRIRPTLPMPFCSKLDLYNNLVFSIASMIPLKGFVQNYSWGKIGKNSQVALLCENKDGFKVDERTPYAELWMGTHSKGPTKILGSNQLLSEWLFENNSTIGDQFYSAIKSEAQAIKSVQLPFLFKVLSVNEALSIQVHPTKEQAKILHAKDPKNYPDDNHKPEMAIALTPFEMMCGFRPTEEIFNLMEDTPELKALVGEQAFNDFKAAFASKDEKKQKAALKTCFSSLMRQDKARIEENLKLLCEKYSKSNSNKQPTELVQRLQKAFPGDVGCFAVFFLNCLTLQPGEAVFLGPNEPHAYLFGDCVECMACSDNTIRAGLTPKFKDVDNLVDKLTYSMRSVSEIKFAPQILDANLTVYRPPVPEFVVHKIEIAEGSKSYKLKKLDVCSILLCIKGKAVARLGNKETRDVAKGDIYFIASNLDVELDATEKTLLFRGFCDQIRAT